MKQTISINQINVLLQLQFIFMKKKKIKQERSKEEIKEREERKLLYLVLRTESKGQTSFRALDFMIS